MVLADDADITHIERNLDTTVPFLAENSKLFPEKMRHVLLWNCCVFRWKPTACTFRLPRYSSITTKFRRLSLFVAGQKNLVWLADEVTLLSHLRAYKFDMKRAIKMVNNYFTTKKNYPEFFDNECYQDIKRSAKDQFINVLPYRDNDGCASLLYKFRKWDVQETSVPLLFHLMSFLVMSAVADVATQVCGVKIIADTNGLTARHITACHPKYLHMIALGMKKVLPLRIKGLHIINDSTAVKVLWNIISYVLSDKINKRVRLHGSDRSGLAKYFDPRLLPKEYGGVLDFDNSTLLNEIETREEEYLSRVHSGFR